MAVANTVFTTDTQCDSSATERRLFRQWRDCGPLIFIRRSAQAQRQ